MSLFEACKKYEGKKDKDMNLSEYLDWEWIADHKDEGGFGVLTFIFFMPIYLLSYFFKTTSVGTH